MSHHAALPHEQQALHRADSICKLSTCSPPPRPPLPTPYIPLTAFAMDARPALLAGAKPLRHLKAVCFGGRSEHARKLVGDEWIHKHKKIVQQHQAMYQKLAWSKVVQTLGSAGRAHQQDSAQGEVRPLAPCCCHSALQDAAPPAGPITSPWNFHMQTKKRERKDKKNKKKTSLLRAFISTWALTRGTIPGNSMQPLCLHPQSRGSPFLACSPLRWRLQAKELQRCD